MKVVTIGEVMMRLSTPNHLRLGQVQSLNVTYGGGEANVAASLAQFGLDAYHVTLFPDNPLGKAATQYYASHKVKTDYIQFQEGRLGTYFVEFGAGHRSSQIVYDRDASVFSKAKSSQFNWDEILEGAAYFQWTGITPGLSQNCLELTYDALEACKQKGVKVVSDINFRSNLWKYGKNPLKELPELLKYSSITTCSEKDALEILGLQLPGKVDYSKESFERMIPILKDRFPNLDKVITSRRNVANVSSQQLTAIGWDGESVLESNSLTIGKVIDRIGSGDAYLAGIIFGESQGWDFEKSLNFGNTAAVMKHSIHGDINLCSVAEIEEVMTGKSTGRIKR